MTVNITEITLKNLKNIYNGNIVFSEDSSNIVGLYGQNGSGKTTVIQALDIVKKLLSGEPIQSDMYNYISVNQDFCEIIVSFSIEGEYRYKVIYDIQIAKDGSKECKIQKEKLSFSKYELEEWSRKSPIFEIDTEANCEIFTPKSRYDSIVKFNKENKLAIPVSFKVSEKEHTSFVFSSDFRKIIESSSDTDLYNILSSLNLFAEKKLFVITTLHSNLISLDILTMAIRHGISNNEDFVEDVALPILDPLTIRNDIFVKFSSVIENLSNVLKVLVPGKSIEIKNYGSALTKNGEEGVRFELISKNGDVKFPIRYESEGIKKLLSVLSVLIAMYNDSSICVAIDELDAGIFEVLLGMFLKIIEENGKGQLIFTSHNLRPLETLIDRSIVFTTTNPKNSYIRIPGIRDSNNLRDIYIRAIKLGGQKEELVNEFRESEIRRALRVAGKNYV